MVTKKKKRVRFKVKNIIILLFLFGFISLMGYCFVMMPINNIYINGNNIVSDNEVMEMVNIDEYPSFLLANRFKMRDILTSNSYIKSVDIKKKIGNVLEFDVVEYRVVATDKDGMVILSSSEIVNNIYGIYDVPLLLNEISDLEVYKMFCIKMEKIDKNIFRQVSEIEYSPTSVDKERFLFYMNDGNLVNVTLTKLDKINKYNKIKDQLGGKGGIIYLDSGDYVELYK